jgi:hypothetical protein
MRIMRNGSQGGVIDSNHRLMRMDACRPLRSREPFSQRQAEGDFCVPDRESGRVAGSKNGSRKEPGRVKPKDGNRSKRQIKPSYRPKYALIAFCT